MPETILWILLEVGVALALVPCVYGIVQWNHRRVTEKAIRALAAKIKQAEAERKLTLTAILTGAHHLPEQQSAELASSLILSERAFFRFCFNTLISQDKAAIEHLGQNLYNVLDDYLRKCATDNRRAAPSEIREVAPVAVSAPQPPPPALEPEPQEEEVDWDAAFAELDDASLDIPAKNEPPPAPALDDGEPSFFGEDTEDSLFDGKREELEMPPEPEPEPEADAAPVSDEDIMAAWGDALQEQEEETAKKSSEDDFDLGWDDAFLEETVVTAEKEKKA